jgi:vacuolar-type H+-ATPase subunit D/Vma8
MLVSFCLGYYVKEQKKPIEHVVVKYDLKKIDSLRNELENLQQLYAYRTHEIEQMKEELRKTRQRYNRLSKSIIRSTDIDSVLNSIVCDR